ncbi:NAD(P)/FAD-dependent oxidoreductase [Saccharopolyspora sp. 5N708]|uniref:NAD(P)/FAD-dependent oxidoreductase n=1 Tax=Saccharopolyspora sp. 5N708 TaxID=3457424 RepID=UPI003FD068CB
MLNVDLLIVGAGPVGLYAAYYAGFRGLEVAVVDSLPDPGGQITALYPEKSIYDVAGLPAVRGRDLVEGLLTQADQFKPHYRLGRGATELAREPDGWTVTTDGGEQIRTKAIVIAGGIGTFTPRPLPAGEDYLDRGLTYFVPNPAEYTDREVVVVGGGDSAVDWANLLVPIARKVVLVHRRDAFRAHAASVTALRASTVELRTPCVVDELFGNGSVEGVRLRELTSKTTSELRCDAVIAALGFTADLGPLESWGIHIEDRHVLVDSRMATNLPGIFAAGDITEYDGKVRLIAVGFGEAATAVNNAAVLIDPSTTLFPGHSTDSAA